MNPAALLEQHRGAVLGCAAAGVVGLALLAKRKKTTGSSTGTNAAGVVTASPQAALTGAAGYNSSASDVYNSLQPTLEQILNNQQSAPLSVPAPVASSLFAPSGSGSFVRYGDGGIYEVESDGSLFGLTPNQNVAATTAAKTAGNIKWEQLQGNAPTGTQYSTEANLARRASGSAG